MAVLQSVGEPVQKPLDLGVLLHNADTLVAVTAPLSNLFRLLAHIHSWESSTLCITLLLVLNIVCLLLPTVFQLFLSLAALCLLAVLGYSQRQTGGLDKFLPASLPGSACDGADELTADESHTQLMLRFRTLLAHVNTFVEWLTYIITKFYSVLKWENVQKSICAFASVTVVMCCLHILPMKGNILLLVNAFLLHKPIEIHFVSGGMQYMMAYQQQKKARQRAKSLPAISVTADMEPEVSSVSEPDQHTECELEITDESDTSSDGSEYEFDLSDQQDTSKSQALGSDSSADGNSSQNASGKTSGVIGRIRELKKRRQATSGSCVECAVNFTTFLKRRRVCTYCGNHFCSKCCSHKVPKSLFGVTAPGALQETVNVCGRCETLLTGDKEKTS